MLVSLIIGARETSEKQNTPINIHITGYLQQYKNGVWNNVKSWTESSTGKSVTLGKDWYVESEFYYSETYDVAGETVTYLIKGRAQVTAPNLINGGSATVENSISIQDNTMGLFLGMKLQYLTKEIFPFNEG